MVVQKAILASQCATHARLVSCAVSLEEPKRNGIRLTDHGVVQAVSERPNIAVAVGESASSTSWNRVCVATALGAFNRRAHLVV
jgi:hypothetical protein